MSYQIKQVFGSFLGYILGATNSSQPSVVLTGILSFEAVVSVKANNVVSESVLKGSDLK